MVAEGIRRCSEAISGRIDVPMTILAFRMDDEEPGPVTTIFPTRRSRARLDGVG